MSDMANVPVASPVSASPVSADPVSASPVANVPMPNVPPLARGWTVDAKVRFCEHLAIRGHVRAACARVGLSAESAYRLRRRDPLFARAWAVAMVLARDHSEQVMACRALDGVEEPIYYRGELVGTRQRYDGRLLLAHMARLDSLAQHKGAVRDAGRFDALLATMTGLEAPAVCACDADGLPMPRAQAVERAVAAALDEMDEQMEGCSDEEIYDIFETCRADATEAATADWDSWHQRVVEVVDRIDGALAEAEAKPGVAARAKAVRDHAAGGTRAEGPAPAPSEALVEALAGAPAPTAPALPAVLAALLPEAGQASGAAERDPEDARRFTPCTVSTVSTSALGQAIGGPVQGYAVADHPAFHARKARHKRR